MATSTNPFSLPQPLRNLFSRFPLYTYPAPASPYHSPAIKSPTLWIHPPQLENYREEHEPQLVLDGDDLLSSDVECLKWQAYLALRALKDIQVRWDVSPDGGIDGRLPNLHVPLDTSSKGMEQGIKDDGEGELLAAHLIPEWVARKLGDVGPLEGYVDEAARDESRAWVTVLENNVHAMLVSIQRPDKSRLARWSPYHSVTRPVESMLTPPPAPMTGFASIVPPAGIHLERGIISIRYEESIEALSDRLGTDRWFLGSPSPTALDALAFAYLHTILNCHNYAVRFHVSRRVNLVAWEQRVSREIRAAFIPYTRP